MIQNHLLQILSLVLMEYKPRMTQRQIHNEKVRVLKKIKPLPAKYHLLGQYSSYKKELKEAGLKNKGTETFAKIVLNCENKKWDGVSLILKTGKRLKRKCGQIRINFKKSPKTIRNITDIGHNNLIIDIYPKQDISLELNTIDFSGKKSRKQVKFLFSKESEFGPNTIDEYSILLEEAIKGNKTLFARDDEIRESWKIVGKINRIKKRCKMVIYKDHTDPEKVKN